MDFPAWDPVLLDIPGLPIDIRWYGLMYIVGFIAGQWILTRLARAGFLPVRPEAVPDLIFYCVFGVMLGGRVGYALFYDQSLCNPLQFVQVWKGGLAFHGGLLGVGIAMWLFSRRHRAPWTRVVDACAIAVTPGILAVRIANFINGELYGRVTSKDTPFAMQFPTDPRAKQLLGISDRWTMRDQELCIQVAYGKRTFADARSLLSDVDDMGRPIPWDSIAPRLDWPKVSAAVDAGGEPLVPFRHPSQVYEGLCEGLLLGVVLLLLYLATRSKPLRAGVYTVTFLVGYAVARGSLELVRQPDPQLGPNVLFGMTMGQLLSAGLVVIALAIVFWPRRPPATPPASPPAGSTAA